MGRIAVLAPALANQIAAGEVIERPASAVKELVENAIDAGATRVRVAVRAGGCEQIIVRDDGEGMGRADAELAFARHATSKIAHADDLVGIGTFGFRGEALASLAAAADVELVTRRAGEDIGTRVRARGGIVVEVGDAGSAPGTQVEVRDLFGELPARRKFLKRPATEFGHIAEVVSRIALSLPRVGFTLVHDAREVLTLPPVATPAERLLQVLGREYTGGMIRFDAQTPVIRVEAYLGRPEHSLSSARLVLTYVDGRFVRDRVLTRAMLDGYQSVLMRGRYPIAAAFLSLARGEVDVNVHPAKAEVRFRDPGRMHQLLAGGIASRLREVLNRPDLPGSRGGVGPNRTTWAAPPPGVQGDPARIPPGAGSAVGADRSFAWTGQRTEPRRETEVGEAAGEYRSAAGAPARGEPNASVEPVPSAGALLARGAGFFSSLRFLGQVLEGYLVCGSSRGLVLIDQHAAHERVRFEHLRADRDTGTVAVQRLLVPQPLALGARDLRAIEEAQPALARLGFEGEPFGDGVYLLRAVPAVLADADCAALLRDVAAQRGELGASRAAEDAVEALLATVACHSAIRVGRRLGQVEVEALLDEMDRVDLAGYCPHGRPAFVELDAVALGRMFKR